MPRYSLKRSPWYEHHVAGRLVGAGEHRAEHHGVRAGGDRLRDVAGRRDAAVGDQRDAVVGRRRPRSRRSPSPAARRRPRRRASCRSLPGPTPAFTASAPASISASAASRVATLPATSSTRAPRLDPAHHLEHAGRVPVRRVDDEHVDARVDQRLRALERVGADADRRADAQPPLLVLRRVRVLDLLLDVLDGDQALEPARRRRRRAASRSCCGGGSPRPRRASCRPAR